MPPTSSKQAGVALDQPAPLHPHRQAWLAVSKPRPTLFGGSTLFMVCGFSALRAEKPHTENRQAPCYGKIGWASRLINRAHLIRKNYERPRHYSDPSGARGRYRHTDALRLPRSICAPLRRRRLPVAVECARPELRRRRAQSLRPRRAEPLLSAAGLAAVLGADARIRDRSARIPRGLAGAAP